MKTRFLGIMLLIGILLITGWSNEKSTNTSSKNSDEVESQLFYVPNAGDGTISVINPKTSKKVDALNLGTDQSSHSIALSLEGKLLELGQLGEQPIEFRWG